MRITALEPQQHHAERVNLYVDGEFRCGLAAELALSAGLRVGDPIDAARLAELERGDLLWKAREAALNLLSYRARSAAELRRRLLRKEFPEEVVESCVARMVEAGYVDDEAFAASFVRDRVRLRPRGARRLQQELRAKGVDSEVAEGAVEEVFEEQGVDDAGLALEAARAWARRSIPGAAAGRPAELADPDAARTARRRLYAYLSRRGFGGEAIALAVDRVIVRPD